jgi:hypothetical protein
VQVWAAHTKSNGGEKAVTASIWWSESREIMRAASPSLLSQVRLSCWADDFHREAVCVSQPCGHMRSTIRAGAKCGSGILLHVGRPGIFHPSGGILLPKANPGSTTQTGFPLKSSHKWRMSPWVEITPCIASSLEKLVLEELALCRALQSLQSPPGGAWAAAMIDNCHGWRGRYQSKPPQSIPWAGPSQAPHNSVVRCPWSWICLFFPLWKKVQTFCCFLKCKSLNSSMHWIILTLLSCWSIRKCLWENHVFNKHLCRELSGRQRYNPIRKWQKMDNAHEDIQLH